MKQNFFAFGQKFLRYAWAAPNTSIGLMVGLVGMLAGSEVQWRRGCLEFSGPWLAKILKRFPPHGARAMTLGHTIIGVDPESLEECRNHEHVHVRQYERWGPFFLPVYLSCSFYLWILNRDYYRGNPFEIEAFSKEKG
jgi:hypothetical protein